MRTCHKQQPCLLPALPALFVGAIALLAATQPALAQDRSPGGELDLGDYQGHVDIPEIAGTPGTGGGGLWPPRLIEITSPGEEWNDFRPLIPIAPLPLPEGLPREDEAPPGSGPQEILPAVILPGSVAPSDGASSAPSSIPAPGVAALVGLALGCSARRRRR